MSWLPWSSLEPANVSFCEPRLDALIAEPANTWSSVAYLVGAALLFARVRTDRRYVLLLIPIASLCIGLGSFFFHATTTFVAQFVDEASMFLISGLMVTMALRRLRSWSASISARFYVALVLSSVFLLLLVKTSGIIAFAVQIGATVLLELALARLQRKGVDHRWLWITIGVYAAASVIWLSDLLRVLCHPATAHIMNGHVVWHVLTSACLIAYYRYQEQFVPRSVR